MGCRQLSRDTFQNGVAHRCAFMKLSTRGGVIAPFWGSANLSGKVSRSMGYRSDSIAILRNMGPLSGWAGEEEEGKTEAPNLVRGSSIKHSETQAKKAHV